jgi:hypothetical protein
MCIFILFLLLTSCNSNETENGEIVACGVHQPQENLPWLKELIVKAETDRTGQCLGSIWLVRYRGQDIFVTNMGFGSGGIAYWFLDCSGNHLIRKNEEGSYCPSAYIGDGHFFVEDEEDFGSFISNLRLENKDIPVIYSNIPF